MLGPPDNPEWSPYLGGQLPSNLNSICNLNTPVPCIIHSQVLGIRMWASLEEPLFCLSESTAHVDGALTLGRQRSISPEKGRLGSAALTFLSLSFPLTCLLAPEV